MKIAIVSNDTTYTYNLRYQIIRRLQSAGHEIIIITQPRFFISELEQMGCRLSFVEYNRHGKNPFLDLYLFLKYFSILKTERPDALFSYNMKPNIYCGMACRLLGIRFFPNISGLGTALEFPGLMQKLTSFLYRVGISRAEAVFFQNRDNLSFFKTRKLIAPKTHAVLLPGSGVNLSKYLPLPYPDGDTIRFLFVSRILKEKGIDYYLHAANIIRKTHPNTAFHVCGFIDDPQYHAIINDSVLAGDIIYHGEQLYMQPFYEMASCVVHPSYYPEGMSNTLLEAAACARPIITTDRCGCVETVDNGKTGFIIPVQNEEELINALERFLELSWEERRHMGLLGREKMEREFDRSIVAERYIQVLSPEKNTTEEKQTVGL